jgi:hypothetical protein
VARQDQPGHVRERAHGRFAPDGVEERFRLVALCVRFISFRRGASVSGREGGEGGKEER